MTVRIKPHHLLDVYKLHGRGMYPFKPDPRFGHDFFRIGNALVEGRVTHVYFTVGADDICSPCTHKVNGVCGDAVEIGAFTRKHDYNAYLDAELMRHLGLREDTPYAMADIPALLLKKMTPRVFATIWRDCPSQEVEQRCEWTLRGVAHCLGV